jgi:hypothetical protein
MAIDQKLRAILNATSQIVGDVVILQHNRRKSERNVCGFAMWQRFLYHCRDVVINSRRQLGGVRFFEGNSIAPARLQKERAAKLNRYENFC